MQVCLIRHAIAEERGPRYPDDRERPLTTEGREKMETAARGLARLFTPAVILTSPLVRARQTAGIVAAACGSPPIVACAALATGDDEALLAALRAAGHDRVACTGHEPLISATLSFLLTGDHDTLSAVFKKGTAALVSFEGEPAAGRGWLEWLIQPAGLRAMA